MREGRGAAAVDGSAAPTNEPGVTRQKPASGNAAPQRTTEMPGKYFTGHDPMPGKIHVRERTHIAMPGKDREEAAERRGWIEYARRGTKNPKRYAYRRRWIRDSSGNWVKSNPKRLKSIRPMTEEEYVRRITGEGRDPTTGRRKRDRGD